MPAQFSIVCKKCGHRFVVARDGRCPECGEPSPVGVRNAGSELLAGCSIPIAAFLIYPIWGYVAALQHSPSVYIHPYFHAVGIGSAFVVLLIAYNAARTFSRKS